MSRSLATFILTVSALFLPAGDAEACSCIGSGPPCQAYWASAIVFDATVISITPTSRPDMAGDFAFTRREKVVVLKLNQAWKGIDETPGTQLEAVTAADDSACGYSFDQGRRYLIFARTRNGDGRVEVNQCSATRPFDGTGDDATFLASLGKPSTGGRLFGQVWLQEQHLDWSRSAVREPLNGITVVADGPGARRETTTRDGRYEFAALPPGTYDLTVRLPRGLEPPSRTSSMSLPDVHACGEVDFWTRSDGRIEGQVLAEGQPSANVQVEVMVAGAAPTRIGQGSAGAKTDAAGFYTIRGLPPGRYVVGVNLRYGFRNESPYPRTYHRSSEFSEPTVVEIARGESVALSPLLLRAPARAVTLTGTVLWSNGEAVTEGDVFVSDVTEERRIGAGGSGLTAGGWFTLSVREGRTYVVQARAYQPGTRKVIATGRSAAIRAGVETAAVKIVLANQDVISTPRSTSPGR